MVRSLCSSFNHILGFRQATFYLAELFRQATFYLAELFRQATFYLAELFRQATFYWAELSRQIAFSKIQLDLKNLLQQYKNLMNTNDPYCPFFCWEYSLNQSDKMNIHNRESFFFFE